MKISMEIYTLAERFGDFRAIEIAKEAGFDAIDYSYYYAKECEDVLGDGYKEYAKSLRAHMDEVCIECNQAHAPFTLKYGLDDELYRQKFLWMVHAVESAAILGAKNIVAASLGIAYKDSYETARFE